MTIEMNLQKGLVGHWTMNNIDSNSGEIKDKSGYNHNLSIDGPSKGYPGISGNSFNFVRSESDELNGSYSSLYVKREMTVVVNLRPRSFSDFQAVLVRRDSNGRFNYRLMLESGPEMRVRLDSGASVSQIQIDDDVPVSLSTDEWYSIGFTYDGSDVVYYIDGDDIVTKSIGSHTWADAQGLKIGNETDNSRHFDGLISDARVYNRALSKQEMSSLSNISSNRSYGSPYVPQRPVAAGDLVAWYPFEAGDAVDATAFQTWAQDNTDYSATVNGPAYQETGGVTDIRRGVNSGAFDFDGTDDKLDLGTVADSDQSLTFMAWVKPDTLTEFQRVITKNDGQNTSPDGSIIFGINDSGQPRFLLREGGTFQGPTASPSLTAGQFAHLAARYDFQSGDATLFINGQPVTSNAVGQLSALSSQPWRIGENSPAQSKRFFDGTLDDARIYQAALSDSQIDQAYLNTEP